MLSMETLNLKDFKGGMLHRHDQAWSLNWRVGHRCWQASSSQPNSRILIWDLHEEAKLERKKRIKHKDNFMHNLVRFKAAKIAHPNLEFLKQGDSGRTKVGLPKCLEAQISLDNF